MSLWNWLTGNDEANAQAASAANAKLQEMNSVYAPGGKYYTPENYAAVQANYQAQDAALGINNTGYQAAFGGGKDAFSVQNQQAAINQAFDDELDARADSIFGGPLRVLGKVARASLFAMPLWVWLVGGVAVFAYFGGFTWLRGALAKGK